MSLWRSFSDDITCISSRIEESTRTLVVLDVDGYRRNVMWWEHTQARRVEAVLFLPCFAFLSPPIPNNNFTEWNHATGDSRACRLFTFTFLLFFRSSFFFSLHLSCLHLSVTTLPTTAIGKNTGRRTCYHPDLIPPRCDPVRHPAPTRFRNMFSPPQEPTEEYMKYQVRVWSTWLLCCFVSKRLCFVEHSKKTYILYTLPPRKHARSKDLLCWSSVSWTNRWIFNY